MFVGKFARISKKPLTFSPPSDIMNHMKDMTNTPLESIYMVGEIVISERKDRDNAYQVSIPEMGNGRIYLNVQDVRTLTDARIQVMKNYDDYYDRLEYSNRIIPELLRQEDTSME